MKIDDRLFSIIATIGPSCNKIENLVKLKKAGVSIFRVNMSHSTIEDLKKIGRICLKNNIEIGLDTEGAQIRIKSNKTSLETLWSKHRNKSPRFKEYN